MDSEFPLDKYAQGAPRRSGDNNGVKTVKVLGIVSIVTSVICCWIYGIPGLITGIIGLVLSNGERKKMAENPENYSMSDANELKTYRIMNIIGICVSSIWILFLVAYFVFAMSFAAADIFQLREY